MNQPSLPAETVLPPRTLTGRGLATQILRHAAAFGPVGLLLHGASARRSGILDAILAAAPKGIDAIPCQHDGGEPTLDQVGALLVRARTARADWIVALGGGSVMDLAKACAALVNADRPVVAYHDGAPVPGNGIPVVAVPTTAGTGSEATIVSVLINAGTGVKKSFRHPSMIPQLVVLDPLLLKSCPPPVLAASGMDAFTQAIESYVSTGASWLSDQFAIEAAARIASALPNVYRGRFDPYVDDLLVGSYLAGLALSNARLGLVHGLAHPLGARFHLSHGLVCAACLPHVLAFNRAHMADKYQRLSEALDRDLTETVALLTAELAVVSPFPGRPLPDRAAVIAETLESGSTKANPRPVDAAGVASVLDAIFAA